MSKSKIQSKTGWEDSTDESISIAVAAVLFAFFWGAFWFLLWIPVAIRQGHWYFIAWEVCAGYAIKLLTYPFYRKYDKYGKSRKRLPFVAVSDISLWIVMATTTGFSWTVVLYILYNVPMWCVVLWGAGAVLEQKRRKDAKNNAVVQTDS